MTDDLTTRLRRAGIGVDLDEIDPLMTEAADRIEALEAERDSFERLWKRLDASSEKHFGNLIEDRIEAVEALESALAARDAVITEALAALDPPRLNDPSEHADYSEGLEDGAAIKSDRLRAILSRVPQGAAEPKRGIENLLAQHGVEAPKFLAAVRRVAPLGYMPALSTIQQLDEWQAELTNDEEIALYAQIESAFLAPGATADKVTDAAVAWINGRAASRPLGERVITREVAFCAEDGLPDWQHDAGVDEDTDGHGPWYTLDTWERIQALAAIRRVAPDRQPLEEHTLARALYVADNWGLPNAGEDWDSGKGPSFILDRYLSLAHRLLASGVLGVPTDQGTADRETLLELLNSAQHAPRALWRFDSTHFGLAMAA